MVSRGSRGYYNFIKVGKNVKNLQLYYMFINHLTFEVLKKLKIYDADRHYPAACRLNAFLIEIFILIFPESYRNGAS